MKIYQVKSMIGREPTVEVPLPLILAECELHGAIKVLSPAEYHTDRQRKFWKGILLPSLSKDSGDSVAHWEAKLKLAVMPDQFQPQTIVVGECVFSSIPSITTLSKKQMSDLIDGSVQQLHEWGFTWVTTPDETRRS